MLTGLCSLSGGSSQRITDHRDRNVHRWEEPEAGAGWPVPGVLASSLGHSRSVAGRANVLWPDQLQAATQGVWLLRILEGSPGFPLPPLLLCIFPALVFFPSFLSFVVLVCGGMDSLCSPEWPWNSQQFPCISLPNTEVSGNQHSSGIS